MNHNYNLLELSAQTPLIYTQRKYESWNTQSGTKMGSMPSAITNLKPFKQTTVILQSELHIKNKLHYAHTCSLERIVFNIGYFSSSIHFQFKNELQQSWRSLEDSKKHQVTVNTLYSWIAVFEQVATRYPICANFCCFGPVTIYS